MSDHARLSELYEDARRKLEPHLHTRSNGTFFLDITDGRDAGIDDPVIFADLKRSVEQTNALLERGEIKTGRLGN